MDCRHKHAVITQQKSFQPVVEDFQTSKAAERFFNEMKALAGPGTSVKMVKRLCNHNKVIEKFEG